MTGNQQPSDMEFGEAIMELVKTPFEERKKALVELLEESSAIGWKKFRNEYNGPLSKEEFEKASKRLEQFHEMDAESVAWTEFMLEAIKSHCEKEKKIYAAEEERILKGRLMGIEKEKDENDKDEKEEASEDNNDSKKGAESSV